jgi:cytochrome c biogenesis factor
MADARSFIGVLISASFMLFIACSASAQAPAGQAVEAAKATAEAPRDKPLWADPVFLVMVGIFLIVGVMGVMVTREISGSGGKSSAENLPAKQLHFAAASLTGLMLIFSLSMAMAYWGRDKGKEVFDTTKTIIPPIATLILGYYFGKTETKDDGSRRPPDGTGPNPNLQT